MKVVDINKNKQKERYILRIEYSDGTSDVLGCDYFGYSPDTPNALCYGDGDPEGTPNGIINMDSIKKINVTRNIL